MYIYNYIYYYIYQNEEGIVVGERERMSVIYVSIICTYFTIYSKYIIGEKGKGSIKISSPRNVRITIKQDKYIYN